MNTPNFRAEVKGKTLRLEIYDQIGPSWLGMIDAKSVAKSISDAGDVSKIDVHINSPGGSTWDGLAIFNQLKEHPAKVRVKVDGVAASAASLIAMAGDTIEMPKNALMMIHNPWTFAMGYADELRKEAGVLDKHKTAAVETYLTRVKKSSDEISKLMDDETWFTGEEAAEAGFADKTTNEVKVLASATASVASEVSEMFRHAPSNFSALFAMSMSKPTKEAEPMPESKTAEQIAAEAKNEAEVKAAAEKAAADLKAKQDAEVKNAADGERKRAAEIMAVCNLAKKPELAADFIANGASLADVNAAMVKVLCQERPPTDDGAGADPKPKDENAGYKAEYAKDKALHAETGMSEEAYVSVRRIEDKKDQLKTKTAAA